MYTIFLNWFQLNLNFKFECFPNKSQQNQLTSIFGQSRFVWNYFLNKEIETHKSTNKFNFFNQNSADLTKLKKELIWLNDSPSTTLQQTLKNLEKAMKASFKKEKGFPKFKSKRQPVKSIKIQMISSNQLDMDCSTIKLPKLGNLKCKFHRSFPTNFKSCTIKYENFKYFVIFHCTKDAITNNKLDINKSIGIDLNSKTFVLSNTKEISIPKFLKESQNQIVRYSRKMSQASKNSSRFNLYKRKLSKIHLHVRNQREDFYHKLSLQIVKDYDFICLEDLSVKDFIGHLKKDSYFYEFRKMIEYKCELYGKKSLIIDRYFPSTKKCSDCGNIKPKILLSERIYKCDCCNLEINRDLNAAINIRTAGMAGIAQLQKMIVA